MYKLLSFALTLSFMICASNIQANTEIENVAPAYIIGDDVLGVFEYHVPGVDPMYQNGIMHITKEDGAYAVNLQLGETVVPTEDVAVIGKEVKFAVYVEGQRVEVMVVVDGETIKGGGNTDQGPFTMSGTRKAGTE